MATLTRKNPNAFKTIIANLSALEKKVGKAGFFASSVYENGEPVAKIALVHELGATINHPGGTPYKIDEDGMAMFISKENGAGLPVTKPHQIVIPPRPFMRPTIAQQERNWLNMMAQGAKKVLKGTLSAQAVMEIVALKAAGDIAKTISEITSPPLASSTIAKRRNAMANKKLVGSLDKPLVASGIMIDAVTGKAEDA